MEVASLLSPEAVKVFPAVTSKKRLFQEISEILNGLYDVPASLAFEALQEREALGPTGVGHGIALPHARLAGLDRVIGLFVKVEKPLEFDAVDRQPVDLVFALFAPQDAGVDHLKALALVSRTMRNEDLCKKLRANSDPAKIHAMLTDIQTIRAA